MPIRRACGDINHKSIVDEYIDSLALQSPRRKEISSHACLLNYISKHWGFIFNKQVSCKGLLWFTHWVDLVQDCVANEVGFQTYHTKVRCSIKRGGRWICRCGYRCQPGLYPLAQRELFSTPGPQLGHTVVMMHVRRTAPSHITIHW
jgi:hypothetical protein